MSETARCLNPDCRRELTDPASRARGFGPRCWEKRQPQPVGAIIRRLPMLRGRGEPNPDQLELEEAADD